MCALSPAPPCRCSNDSSDSDGRPVASLHASSATCGIATVVGTPPRLRRRVSPILPALFSALAASSPHASSWKLLGRASAFAPSSPSVRFARDGEPGRAASFGEVRTFLPSSVSQSATGYRRSNSRRRKKSPSDSSAQRDLEKRIRTLARTGRAAGAIDAFSSATGIALSDPRENRGIPSERVDVSVRLMNVAIDACARSNPVRTRDAVTIFHLCTQDGAKDERSRRLFAAVTGAPPPIPGARGRRRQGARTTAAPNVFSFGSLLSVLSRAGQHHAALRVLRLMHADYGVAPNAVCYAAAISACDRAVAAEIRRDGARSLDGDAPQEPPANRDEEPPWRMALQLLEEATSPQSHRPPLDMSIVGYNAVLSTLARSGRADEAETLWRTMRTRGVVPDAISHAVLMAACERAGRWDRVLACADAMDAAGLAMDGLALSGALHACERLGNADAALVYLNRMRDGACGRIRRETHGRERDDVRQDIRGPDGVAYALAVGACGRAGRWREATELLEEMRAVTGDRRDVEAEVVAYTNAIGGCALVGEYREALRLIEEMREHAALPNVVAYSAAINACAAASAMALSPLEKSEPMRSALLLLDDMKKFGKDDEDVCPNVVTYNAAIKACGEGLNLQGAYALLEEMIAEGIQPNIVTFGTLMTACERIGKADEVVKVLRNMKKWRIKPNEIVYGAAISCFRKAGEGLKAYLLLHKMLNDGLSPNIVTCNTALISLAEGSHLSEAIQLFQRLDSPNGPGPKPSPLTHTIFATCLAQEGRPEEADALLRRMRRHGHVPGVEVYTAVVAAFEREGRPMEAVRVMDLMREDGHDFYDIGICDKALKGAVRLANTLGRGLAREKWEERDRLLQDVLFAELRKEA
uniref:PROP1-like PPR domain-containing protein n=1 Tax=Corethron hystrix TaxID=216773 RepID=A0A7S1C1I2_9STRA|mmetsp:Transcript_7989/g.17341  ORF Transcript_7989/g.17341 Transcript_7989/m.17341 type:complete len:872 (+) Transcript_7989:103-2718(+)